MKTSMIFRMIGLVFIYSLFGCGDEKEVSDLTVPEIETAITTHITSTTATCGGNVLEDGGYLVYSRGICYGLAPKPTVESNRSISSGSGKGDFECYLNDLTESTTYYVRAYATNSIGTSYGNEESFVTDEAEVSPQKAAVTTVSLVQTSSEYSASGFTYGGISYNYKYGWTVQVELSGASFVSEFGYVLNGEYRCWSLLEDRVYSESWTSYSNTNKLAYTCKAYAKLLDGTYIYGEEKTITLAYGTKALVYEEEYGITKNVVCVGNNVTSIGK